MAWLVASSLVLTAAEPGAFDASKPLALPEIGSYQLQIISPTLLELMLVSTKAPDPARVTQWDFVGENFVPKLPEASEFRVLVGGTESRVRRVGFKRRAIYGPLKRRDFRIG